MFRVTTGQAMKTLDNLDQKSKNSRHGVKLSNDGFFENHQI